MQTEIILDFVKRMTGYFTIELFYKICALGKLMAKREKLKFRV